MPLSVPRIPRPDCHEASDSFRYADNGTTMNTGSLYSELTGKIHHVRRKEHGIAVQTGIINALTATLAVWLLAVSIEALGELEPAGRTVLFWGTVGVNALLALWFMVPSLGRYLGVVKGQDDDTIARRVGSASARNTASRRSEVDSTMWLNIGVVRVIVNHRVE